MTSLILTGHALTLGDLRDFDVARPRVGLGDGARAAMQKSVDTVREVIDTAK